MLLQVGIFGKITGEGSISTDDLYLWRRTQFPAADPLYKTTLAYKLQLDVTAYTQEHDWDVITFAQATDYLKNLSVIIDNYPQTPILVGWQVRFFVVRISNALDFTLLFSF